MVNPRFVIKAVLSGQRLNINVPLTVAGTVNYIGVEAKCTSEWDDCTVVCYLYQAGTGYTAQLGLIYDTERKLYYFPNAERLTLTAGEWAVWFVGVMAESGQETYRVTSDTRYFSVYPNPFASSIPPGDISLDEEALARATDAQNKANLLLDKYNAGELTGPQGEPGDPAEIGFVQASVDSTTDNPSCVVTVTENPENTYNMQFAFSGIKGAKGDTGATGPKGDTGAQGAPGRDGTNGRDGVDGQTIDDYVLVQAEQPTSETNKMWLKPAGGSPVMIPTLEEFENLQETLDEIGETIYSKTISGVRYVEDTETVLPKGKYFLHIDNVVSSDTDSLYSSVRFYQLPYVEKVIFFNRGRSANVFFELLANCNSHYFYASNSSASSTGDTFTYTNVTLVKLNSLGESLYDQWLYYNMPFRKLDKNPYRCNLNAFNEIISTTHAHCENATQLENLAIKYDHVAISNYYPSSPLYPLDDFYELPITTTKYSGTINGTRYYTLTLNPPLPVGEYIFKCDSVTSSDTDETQCLVTFRYNYSFLVDRNVPVEEKIPITTPCDTLYFYASTNSAKSSGDTFEYANVKINKLLDLMVSPNAEQAKFDGAFSTIHINSVGSYLSRNTEANGDTVTDVIRDAILSMKNQQQGGITINHPTWSDLTINDIVQLTTENNGIFAMEIYNSNCEAGESKGFALTLWDNYLATGRQLYGVAVPDHEVQYHPTENRVGFGYCHVFTRGKTEEEILNAYTSGRFYSSICNDSLKFTNIIYKLATGMSVDVSSSCQIKFITANGVVKTETGTSSSYIPDDSDIYVRVEATDGTNTLYTNAVIL